MLRLLILWIALPLCCASCGAGLIGGAVASNDGGGGSSTAPPSLSLPTQAMPLSPSPLAAARTVVIANAVLSPNAALDVQLRVPGPSTPDGQPTYRAVASQLSPVLLSGQGSSTVVGFQLRTEPITSAVGAISDVAAQIAVLADGREVAPPLPVTLLAQPSLRLLDGVPRYLSPNGGQVVRFACRNLRSVDASGLAVFVTTVDASGVSRDGDAFILEARTGDPAAPQATTGAPPNAGEDRDEERPREVVGDLPDLGVEEQERAEEQQQRQ